MFHSRKHNNKIKHLHERCLRVIYSDEKSSYEHLLEKDNSDSIHHKNIQALAFGMFKVKRKLCREITSDIFMERTNNHYNLRNCTDFLAPQVNKAFVEQKVFHILDLRYGMLFQKNLNARNH